MKDTKRIRAGQVLHRTQTGIAKAQRQGPGLVLAVHTKERLNFRQLLWWARKTGWSSQGLALNYVGGKHVATLWIGNNLYVEHNV